MGSLLLSGGASWPDPRLDDEDDPAWTARYMPSHLTPADAMWLAGIVDVYRHILAHPAGTEAIVRQVREARRMLKQQQAPDVGREE